MQVDERHGSDLTAQQMPQQIAAGPIAELESGEQVDAATGEILEPSDPWAAAPEGSQ
jgi:hypothetical protein